MKKFLKELSIFILIVLGLFMLVFYPAVNGHSQLASCILGGECGLLAHFIKESINNKRIKIMNKELQDKAWAALPKEFRERVIEVYKVAKQGYEYPASDADKINNIGAMQALEALFDKHCLTSNEEKQELLIKEQYNRAVEISKLKKENEVIKTYLEIHQEVVAMLFAFGYNPKVIVDKPNVGYVDVCFHVDNGYDSMPTHHKDAISMLAKGYLSEFYYCGDIQHVYLIKECKGLEPDDDRYGCLLHEIRLVNSEEPLLAHGLEVFVNMGDHFKRFRKWEDVTSKE